MFRYRLLLLALPFAFIGGWGCNSSGTSSSGPGKAMLTGPEGTRAFREWPLEAATLRGATLTSTEYPNLRWEFAADGTHTLTNGGEPIPAGLKDLIEPPAFLAGKKVTGTWSLKDTLQGTGNDVRELILGFSAIDGRPAPTHWQAYVYPHHSSARYVHFCRSQNGFEGGNRVHVFKVTPAEGQPLPSPPK